MVGLSSGFLFFVGGASAVSTCWELLGRGPTVAEEEVVDVESVGAVRSGEQAGRGD